MNNWKETIENLVEEESNSPLKLFPDNFINSRLLQQVDIQQISFFDENIKILCKITDNFSNFHQYNYDDESIPPKVLCWTDISTVDSKTAKNYVKTGITKEYNHIIKNFDIYFQSVSIGNHDPLPFLYNNNDLIILHILDPSLTIKPRYNPNTNTTLMKVSHSLSHLKDLSQVLVDSPILTSPIHEDLDSMRRFCHQFPDKSIFIFDFSFAKRSFNIILQEKPQSIVFGASSDVLRYSSQIPSDLFTSCLLTPAQVALLWQSQQYSDIKSGILSDIDIQSLIYILNDSPKTLNILNILEICLESCVEQMVSLTLENNPNLFFTCFRSSKILSKLFINFIFSTRILHSYSMNPFSYPELPDFSNHFLWDAFDVHVDQTLYLLKESIKPTPNNFISLKSILLEQLTILESWLWFPNKNRTPPDELQYIAPLLEIDEFFSRTIKFCSEFLKISNNFVITFLNTKAFSAIPKIFSNKSRLNNLNEDICSDISFIVINCLLVSSSLSNYFLNDIDFWLKNCKSNNNNLKIASLCCLLFFSQFPDKIDLYQLNNLNEYLETLINSNIINIRALSHLILSKMNIKMEITPGLISTEKSPLVRATLISRFIITLNSFENIPNDILFELTSLSNDLDNLVREETIIALSHSIFKESTQLSQQICEYCSGIINNSFQYLVPLIGNQIKILTFDTSPRVLERLIEFMNFITSKSENKILPLPISNIYNSCLSKISRNRNVELEPLAFFERKLIINDNNNLIGKPNL